MASHSRPQRRARLRIIQAEYGTHGTETPETLRLLPSSIGGTALRGGSSRGRDECSRRNEISGKEADHGFGLVGHLAVKERVVRARGSVSQTSSEPRLERTQVQA